MKTRIIASFLAMIFIVLVDCSNDLEKNKEETISRVYPVLQEATNTESAGAGEHAVNTSNPPTTEKPSVLRDFLTALQDKNSELKKIMNDHPESRWGELLKNVSHLQINLELFKNDLDINIFCNMQSLQSVTICIEDEQEIAGSEKSINYQFELILIKILNMKIKTITLESVEIDRKHLKALSDIGSITSLHFSNCKILWDISDIAEARKVFVKTMQSFKLLTSLAITNCGLKEIFIGKSEVSEMYRDMNVSSILECPLSNMTLKIEDENCATVLSIISLCYSVRKLIISNNNLAGSLNFLKAYPAGGKLALLEKLSIFNEPKLLHLETDFVSSFPSLKSLDLIGINKDIVVSTDFFSYELRRIEYINIDYHLFVQIGQHDSFFVKEKKCITAYAKGIIDPSTICMRITSEALNSLQKDIVINAKRMKIIIYAEIMERNYIRKISLVIPKSLSTVNLGVEVHTEKNIVKSEIEKIVYAVTNKYQNIKILTFKFPLPEVLQKSIETKFLKRIPNLSFFSFDNLVKDILFEGRSKENGYYKKGNNINTIALAREDAEDPLKWSKLKNQNAILYLVDTRYYEVWIKLACKKQEENQNNYKVRMLPLPAFPNKKNDGAEAFNTYKEDEFTDPNFDLENFMKENKKCQAPKCNAELKCDEKNEEIFVKTNVVLYKQRVNAHSFCVLSCGHYFCISCTKKIANIDSATSLVSGLGISILKKVSEKVINSIPSSIKGMFSAKPEEDGDITNQNQEIVEASHNEKIKITCPLEECNSFNKTAIYYCTDEVSLTSGYTEQYTTLE
ncbi:hypothetical protein NEMIN01_2324 [Nematocida minor]|uniref:uncharacterized protein n=1 Tax=Nematocida minor TaxID=1912983 RepID=UPI00221E3915|nr:uncharacterized protein NEMIN01_2324 [Nematocida minor]KAI5192972.1 hypothetical protein NEMIN01_2324 [Nematocida minor]